VLLVRTDARFYLVEGIRVLVQKEHLTLETIHWLHFVDELSVSTVFDRDVGLFSFSGFVLARECTFNESPCLASTI